LTAHVQVGLAADRGCLARSVLGDRAGQRHHDVILKVLE
jgi:hypothetical protein